MLCPLGDLLAEGGVEWAQAMVAAVLSSRQHRAASPAQTGRGVVEGKQRGLFPPQPQTPNRPPKGTWERNLEKNHLSAGFAKVNSSIRKLRGVLRTLKMASSFPSLLSSHTLETGSWPAVRRRLASAATPAGSLPRSADSAPSQQHPAALPHSRILPVRTQGIRVPP